jgi:hypothetical protein
MSTAPADISDLLRARLCVAYLGEATAREWWKGAWKGSFLQPTQLEQFLRPIFPRTYFAAALRSATQVAAAEHDDGKTAAAGMYHLFRLPIELEDQVTSHVTAFAGEAARAFGIRELPVTILIDRQGRELGRLSGPAAWDSDEAKTLLKAALVK